MLKNPLRLAALFLLVFACAAPPALAAPAPLDLDFLGRTAAGGKETAEIAAFDPKTQRVFATDATNNELDVFDFSSPAAPKSLDPIKLGLYGKVPNSVVYLDDFGAVAVAVQAAAVGTPGSVVVFDAKKGTHIATYPAGALPDMVTSAMDERYLLVANEGEPASDGSVDPEGSVTVIDLIHGLKKPGIRTADFHGVPLLGPVRVYTPGSTVAQDLEPEYITSAGGRAWVSIQEANAIGVLDINSANFKYVRSLGFKDHGMLGNGFDALDTDSTPNIELHPNVFGMYQPDALSAFTVSVPAPPQAFEQGNGPKFVTRTLIATANEGDSRDWKFFAEESRVSSLKLDAGSFPSGEAAKLARLTVTTTLGDDDSDGEYEELYALGGRSMSLLDWSGEIVHDTGDQLEQLSKALDVGSFNKDNAASKIDNRSDNKGPEPEAVTTGEVDGHTYAFLGAERSGMIYAFDLSSTPGGAEFAGWINTREGDLGPEGIEFVPSGKSPTGKPMLLVTYEISGTVAAYEVTP